MTHHVAHKSDELADGGKVPDPVTTQIKDVLPFSLNLYRPEVDTSSIDPQKLKRKIDFRIVPCLALLLLVCNLDTGSIGNARLYGLQKSLHFSDKQYLMALTVFFIPYGLLEVPSNLALKYLRPYRWLPFIVFIWGIVMTFHGFARNYGDLIGLRFLLRLAEAGLAPGIIFYLSCWYKPSQLGARIAVINSAAAIAGAFSGFLTVAIHNMDGIGGRPGWAWIFILEGLFTILIACISYWVLQDFPESAKFLPEVERVYIIREVKSDDGEKLKLKYLWQCLTDWKTYVSFGMSMGVGGPLYSLSLTMPTIINQLGFRATAANLLSVPVYVFACLVTLFISILGDRFGDRGYRGYINLTFLGAGFIGDLILIVSRNTALSYFGIYLVAAALFPVAPNMSAWVSSNVEGSYKRGAALALTISSANLSGVIAVNVYRERDAPWYSFGHGIILICIAIGWFSSLTYTVLLRRENKARDRGERHEVIDALENKSGQLHNGQYSSVDEARREKGDMWSGFRYTV